MISSAADRSCQTAQICPIGCAAPSATESQITLFEHALLLRLARSRSQRAGAARRRGIHSRLLLLRRANSSQAASSPCFLSFTDSCAHSSGTIASSIWLPRLRAFTQTARFSALHRRLPHVRTNPNIPAHHAARNLCLFTHGSSRFSSSTATPVLSGYLPCVLRFRPCLPPLGRPSSGEADPWASRIRRSSRC